MKMRGVIHAFDEWASTAAHSKRMKASAAKVVGRLRNRAVVGAYVSWVATTVETQRMKGVCLRRRKQSAF